MQRTTKLVLGGIGGLLVAAIAGSAIAWASAGRVAEAPGARAEPPLAPIVSPRLEQELATTHRPSTEPPALRTVAPEPPRSEPVLEASGAVRVRRLVIATGIERREPTGASDVIRLREQDRVYAFVDAVNETGEDVTLRVTFEPAVGESAGHVSLHVPARAARFRTWATTRHVYEAGRWEAVVRGPDGHVIARRPFDVAE